MEQLTFTAASPGESGLPVLVRYRREGQRLTVFEDGLVELHERHRTRDPTWLRMDAKDLDRLRVALEEIPERRWSRGPTLVLSRIGFALNRLAWDQANLGSEHFQMRRGHRTISGLAGTTTELTAVALLDGLRWHAIQLAESLQPTR